MAKEDKKDLLLFLDAFPAELQARALWLRDFVWDLYPETNELIYDNYNALAFGWGLSDRLGDVFCSIALYKSINFGFNNGAVLSDPEKKLIGNGNQYRYVKVPDIETFPAKYAETLLHEAYTNSLAKFKPGKQVYNGITIVKSISERKRRASF